MESRASTPTRRFAATSPIQGEVRGHSNSAGRCHPFREVIADFG